MFSSLGLGSDCIISPFGVAQGGLGDPEATNMHYSEGQVSQVIGDDNWACRKWYVVIGLNDNTV